MLTTTVRLVPPRGAPGLSPAEVVDLLWLHAAPPDGVEHIHARAGPAGIDVVVFTVASGQDIADVIVAAVCGRAIRSAPVLSGWTAFIP
ncbi:hypothetical protein Cs7R123_28090 [Catellatospora sp. TT07R-123]|uniref:hypothetical protein n=1 Tax=Catellatospora sp. TT07R-123 TaxID=2733863 RepID=UPI001B1D74F4|nr:hypothetical protein [Catellatospora sp. TT07R-123]GHJ45467.1 hypothetical protein Cs7R123_28090 [Catellatospora sp. TT07R-123]